MAQQIILSSDKKQVSVAPGAKTEFNVTIQNLTTLLDDVAIAVAGVDTGWVQVVPAHVPVFAQGEASVRVILQPPGDATRALCGVYPLQVSGKSQELAGQQAVISVDLEVQFGGDYRLEVGNGTATGSLEASFPCKVHNDANAPLVLRCSGADPNNSFWYKFDPFQLTVPPGGEAEAMLSIRARQNEGQNQSVVFTLSAQGEWSAAGMAAIAAPTHTISSQWSRTAPTTLAVTVEPGSQEKGSGSSYRIRVLNPGPAQEAANLEFSSANSLLNYQFKPRQLTLGPQGQAISDLVVWLATAASPVGTQPIDFWVTARPISPQTRPGSSKASFYPQPAPVKKRPWWVIPAIVIAILILLACVGSLLVFYLSGSH